MANEKPNPLDILMEPGFGHDKPTQQASTAESKPRLAAPASPMTVKVKIEDIQPYDQNPRRAENEKYEEIRESIRDIGLQQQISITKRPNDNHYIVRSGGNTRLKALKELYAETAEERFGLIECRFVPYSNELELLTLHIMENEQRSAMLFIDIAMAAKNFKTMLEKQEGQTISLRKLAVEMKQRGWTINNQHLTYHMYATEIADELPIAFSQGLGRRIVIEIKSLENCVRQWADEKDIDVGKCIQYFRSALKNNDMKSFSVEQTEKDLIDILYRKFNLKFNDVRNAFIVIRDKGTTVNYEDNRDIHVTTPQITNEPIIHQTTSESPAFRNHEPQAVGSQPVSSPPTDLEELADYTPPNVFIPKPIVHEHNGATSQETERNKHRHKLRDCLNLIITKVQKFDQAFTVTTDEYVLVSNFKPKVIVDNAYDEDEIAVWYALHIRSEMLRIAINGKEDRSGSRKDLITLTDPTYLNGNDHLPGIVANHLIQQIVATYPDELIQIYYSSLKKEIIEIYKALPAIDRMIKDYLSHFI